MKRSVWKIVWVVGVYATLVTILYLVVLYKVKWEDKDLNTYLYFYNCSNKLCTSTSSQSNYYSNVLCKKDVCPYISEISSDLVILNDGIKEYVYDYKNSKVISDEYDSYSIINNDYFIVSDSNNLQGIINREGEVVVELKYNKIIDYKDNFVAYKLDNKVGIDNDIDQIYIENKYDDIKLINYLSFAYLEDGLYHMAYYENEELVNVNSYNYLYVYDNIILVFNNNQLDILDIDHLKSKLLMKIRTVYEYRVEKERNSLNFMVEGNLLHFDIFNGNDYTNYIYDLKNSKLYEE